MDGSKGGREDISTTPITCKDDQTIACWLADHGYVVYSIDYTLVSTIATGADLKVTATNTVSTAQHTFTQTDIGSAINILTTGKWTPGGYRITSVSNGNAVLDGSPGATGIGSGHFAVLSGPTLWPV